MKKTKKHTTQHARVNKSRMHIYVIGLLMLSLCILLFVLSRTLINPNAFLIQHIEVRGSHPHVEKNKLRAVLKPYLRANFFTLDVAQMHENLLNIPWIAEVKITRIWPDELMIQITEQKAIAIWNQTELMNPEGEIFSPPHPSFPANLPELSGSPGQQLAVLEAYRKINTMLKPWHLVPAKVLFTPDQSLILVLTNGMQVRFGNDNMYQHFRHFLQAYNDLFLNKENKVDYIDASYPNGMAVKWKS